ncbi:hypothetical protein [Methylophilus aquaticus]|uniref:Uncharacterized protein n=1 Tax=Methylophilus aquaticus TaxID=1971610 RepID=A0ABT9JRR7_9PROT|nr:hypothetical protein [Methylophilus aquaticus]MDP8567263.1 hypothetical protein [Methylophilus aquaticus]
MRHCSLFGMRSCLSAAMCLAGVFSGAAVAEETDARSLKHPLIGYWEARLPDSGCMETYWFKEDGTAVFTSGDEQLEARYTVTPQPDANGFFKLSHRITLSNKAPDCTKQVSEINTEQTTYLLFQPDGRSVISCDNDAPSLESCFGPLELKNNADKSL